MDDNRQNPDNIKDTIENKPKRNMVKIIVPILVAAAVFGIWAYKNLTPVDTSDKDTSKFALDATEDFDLEEILSHGLPVMIDLGADYCEPCREMAPILKELNQEYRGKAVIKFVDIEKNQGVAQGFGIALIPTQFFFDKEGEFRGRHEGFLSKEDIISIFGELGVK